jgi:hypothetical protein
MRILQKNQTKREGTGDWRGLRERERDRDRDREREGGRERERKRERERERERDSIFKPFSQSIQLTPPKKMQC